VRRSNLVLAIAGLVLLVGLLLLVLGVLVSLGVVLFLLAFVLLFGVLAYKQQRNARLGTVFSTGPPGEGPDGGGPGPNEEGVRR
jgi:hypothetical protein